MTSWMRAERKKGFARSSPPARLGAPAPLISPCPLHAELNQQPVKAYYRFDDQIPLVRVAALEGSGRRNEVVPFRSRDS